MRKLILRRLAAVLLVIALCLSLTACGSGAGKDSAQEESVSSDSSVSEPETESDSEAEESLITIEAQYGTLYYPAQWQDVLETAETVTETETEEIDSVTFAVTVDDQEYILFEVMICDAEGDSVGTVTDDSGQTRNVFVDIPELPDLSDLSEEEQNQLYAMQEAINTVIENLQ